MVTQTAMYSSNGTLIVLGLVLNTATQITMWYSPYLHINYATNTVGTKSVSPGDWFRIRHYAATNEIKYQRKETVYSQNTDDFETASGSNYQYISTDRPTVISLDG